MLASVETRSLSTMRDLAETESTTLGSDYWLAHCEGYRVRSPGGRVGIVESVRLVEGADRAASLKVLAGMFGTRRLTLDVSQVEAIVPHEQCVFLKPDGTIVDTEPCT